MLRPLLQRAADPGPALRAGLSFATSDHLALSAHPDLRVAAQAALGQQRTADSTGPTAPVVALETRLADFLRLPAAVSFPSGAEAIRLTFQALLRPEDHVIIDAGAHPAMAEAVRAARAHLHRSPPASVEGIERRLTRLSRQPRRGRLVIAVPAVSAHASRIADLAELSALARSHGAILIADVTHDLGCLGPAGGGIAEIQGTARVDILLGSFARTFGAAGGFAAVRDPALHVQLLREQGQAPALSPVNASVILAALDLVTSAEGHRRRRNLHGLALRFRNHLLSDGIRPMGQASAFVPILLPPETALPRTALLESAGPRVELLHAPQVPLHAPRWRIQLNAAHGPADIDDLAELIRDVSRAFDRQTGRSRVPAYSLTDAVT